MADDADAQILNIQDLYARRQPEQEIANAQFCTAVRSDRAEPAVGRVIAFNDMHAARVIERMLNDWRLEQLDEYSELCGGAATRLAARIVQIYESHPDCIQHIAGKSGELLWLIDALYEDYCQRQEAENGE